MFKPTLICPPGFVERNGKCVPEGNTPNTIYQQSDDIINVLPDGGGGDDGEDIDDDGDGFDYVGAVDTAIRYAGLSKRMYSTAEEIQKDLYAHTIPEDPDTEVIRFNHDEGIKLPHEIEDPDTEVIRFHHDDEIEPAEAEEPVSEPPVEMTPEEEYMRLRDAMEYRETEAATEDFEAFPDYLKMLEANENTTIEERELYEKLLKFEDYKDLASQPDISEEEYQEFLRNQHETFIAEYEEELAREARGATKAPSSTSKAFTNFVERIKNFFKKSDVKVDMSDRMPKQDVSDDVNSLINDLIDSGNVQPDLYDPEESLNIMTDVEFESLTEGLKGGAPEAVEEANSLGDAIKVSHDYRTITKTAGQMETGTQEVVDELGLLANKMAAGEVAEGSVAGGVAADTTLATGAVIAAEFAAQGAVGAIAFDIASDAMNVKGDESYWETSHKITSEKELKYWQNKLDDEAETWSPSKDGVNLSTMSAQEQKKYFNDAHKETHHRRKTAQQMNNASLDTHEIHVIVDEKTGSIAFDIMSEQELEQRSSQNNPTTAALLQQNYADHGMYGQVKQISSEPQSAEAQ